MDQILLGKCVAFTGINAADWQSAIKRRSTPWNCCICIRATDGTLHAFPMTSRCLHCRKRCLRGRRNSGSARMQHRKGKSAVSSARQTSLFFLQQNHRRLRPAGAETAAGRHDQTRLFCILSIPRTPRPFRRERTRLFAAGNRTPLWFICMRWLWRNNRRKLDQTAERKKLCLDCYRSYSRFDV